ncbi:dipeptide epimerase [Halobacterium salinarum]|uniref:dipeptide epimerase n=1 Tax=Halobacterium salinarum TaxID=2242 RepID=UPI002555FF19|nr:dipeptide epimerase [Halobacterium salinarum]MDL0128758.1 dipeptide epimerase [Halobacterium salinarum]MDL0133987.1 dipeptide epimerase [Halobacterium salinarum]
MNTDFERRQFPLEHPFTIARGTQDTATVVTVTVSDDDGATGVGAAAPSAHYGETAATVDAVLPDLLAVVERVDAPEHLARIEAGLRDVVSGNPAARAAVSIACHDLVAKRADCPLYQYWGLDPANTVETSYTIGIDDAETMRENTRAAVDAGFGTLKVKLGTPRDEQRLSAVREAAPDATIRVDANEAWTPREAVRNIERLADYGVEFVEQPVPADHPAGLQFVHERAALPIAADESCMVASDIPQLADKCDIVTLKLMKTGGLRAAMRLIHTATAHGLDVMCGCMIESNASIAAAAHLAPLLDYADLDGSLLLADDDFDGVPMPAGHIDLAAVDGPGTGARE